MNKFDPIVNLDLFNSADWIESNFYVPERNPFSLSFENAEYETTFLIINAANWVVNIPVFVSFHLLLILIFSLVGYCFPKFKGNRQRIFYSLFWIRSIRLLFESYQELFLVAILNIRTIEWLDGIDIVTASNWISYTAIVLLSLAPFLILTCICKHRFNLKGHSFSKKYKTSLDGTKSEEGEFYLASLLSPAYFFVRRIALGLTLVYFNGFFVGQVIVAFLSSILIMAGLQIAPPLKTKFANKLATFDEFSMLIFL